jgi:hypothetical protein
MASTTGAFYRPLSLTPFAPTSGYLASGMATD